MAGHGLAPELLLYTPLGDDLYLVVMEYIEGQTLHDAYDIADPLPLDVRQGVQKALDILEEGNFVFGDLRRPNVMLVHGTQPVEKRIRFIDFDWAGEEGPDLRYPFHLAAVVREASGASDYDLITRAHERNMFKNL
jgi:RIO-like serine/threonine protein kinase